MFMTNIALCVCVCVGGGGGGGVELATSHSHYVMKQLAVYLFSRGSHS